MAGRIRTVKPEWLEDERLLACSERARLLSIALILLADDYGNGRGHPAFVRGQSGLYAATNEETEVALAELEAAKFIERYQESGQSYYSIRNWAKHQKVDKPGKPRVPGPPRAAKLPVPERRKVAYFIRGTATGLIKIGESIDPVQRLADLAACGSEALELLAVGGVERELHAELAASRVHGEWFRPTEQVLAKIRELSGGATEPLARAGYANGKRVVDEASPVPRDDSANVRVVHATDHGHDLEPTEDQRTRTTPAAPGFSLALTEPDRDLKLDKAADLAAHATAAINRVTGRTFDPASKATLKLAKALVKAGATPEQVTSVVERKAAEWLGTSLADRVCPATLLAADNFARYLDEIRAGPVRAAGTANHRPSPPPTLPRITVESPT